MKTITMQIIYDYLINYISKEEIEQLIGCLQNYLVDNKKFICETKKGYLEMLDMLIENIEEE